MGNNGIGVAGVNWNVQIMALKFLGASGSGATSNAITCLDYAVDKGAKISNNSWGGGGFSSAMADALEQRADRPITSSSPPPGTAVPTTTRSPIYPSSYDARQRIWPWPPPTGTTSRPGSRATGRTSVDLAAPGVGILSTYANDTYTTISGTSMATPHVAGAAALVWDAHPTWTYAAGDRRRSRTRSTR